MKTEKEIRRHRDALIVLQKKPCDCDRTGHSQQCYMGLKMMQSAKKTLTWILGNGDWELDAFIEELQRRADALKGQNFG